jgi:hypothetical protein
MTTNRCSLEFTGAQRAADVAPAATLVAVRCHAPIPASDRPLTIAEPADEAVWAELERMLAARERSQSMHPAGARRAA